MVERALMAWNFSASYHLSPKHTTTMKKYSFLPLLALLVMTMSSCEAIAGLFKAGVYTGFIIVGIVVVLIIFLVTRLGGRK